MSDVNDYGSLEDFQKISGAPETTESNVEAPATDEPVFELEGNKVPFSKLTPDQVKEWYESHSAKSKWQREMTQKAQQFATQKKEWETKVPEYQKKVQEWDKFTDFVGKNPNLQGEIEAAFKKYAAASASQAPQPMGRDPAYEQLKRELDDLKGWKGSLEKEREESKLAKDREEAYAALSKRDPNFNKEAFDAYLAEASEKANNLSGLYELVYEAMRAKSAPDVAKAAQKKTLDNIKNKQSAAVETGKGISPKDLPENIDLSQTGSIDELFEKEMERRGLFNYNQ